MKYSEPESISLERVLSILEHGDSDAKCHALVNLVHSDIDWKQAQEICLENLKNTDQNVARVATICLGHIARINGDIDQDRVVKALISLKTSHSSLAGTAEDALSDIDIFINQKKRST